MTMSYRGEDLDLRTSRTWAGAAGDVAGWGDTETLTNGPQSRYAAQQAPIWVDETVLNCCNHAYDVALAHRATEVAVEHLLHAMTRIDASAEVLESYGVRVIGLRRETATIIASELPAGLPNGQGGPRRSDDLEDVLRRAAGRGSRRSGPAGVDDVVAVLSDPRLDGPAAAVFARHAARPLRELAPATRVVAYAPEAHYSDAYDVGRDRYRHGSGPGFPQESYRGVHRREMYDPPAPPPAAGRNDAGTLVQVLDRLTHIEQAVREHKTVATVDPGGLHDALGQMERSVQNNLRELARHWLAVDQRLSALEQRVAAPALNLEPLTERLDGIEEILVNRADAPEQDVGAQIDQVRADLAALGDKLATQQADSATQRLAVTERVEGLMSIVDRQRTELPVPIVERISAVVSSVGGQHAERLTGLDAAVDSVSELLETTHDAAAAQFDDVREALVRLGARQESVNALFETMRTDNGTAFDALAGRIAPLERSTAQMRDILQRMADALGTVHRLTVERYYWRSRFWFWLFGTNDWVAASWPQQTARIDQKWRSLLELRS